MANEMRDRLVEVIGEFGIWHKPMKEVWFSQAIEKLADKLIENGVIVPPCKVGDIVWVDDFMWGLIPCKVDRPYHCICGEKGGCTFERSFTDDDFGKTVFFTKEEAEQKLKGGADNGDL